MLYLAPRNDKSGFTATDPYKSNSVSVVRLVHEDIDRIDVCDLLTLILRRAIEVDGDSGSKENRFNCTMRTFGLK